MKPALQLHGVRVTGGGETGFRRGCLGKAWNRKRVFLNGQVADDQWGNAEFTYEATVPGSPL